MSGREETEFAFEKPTETSSGPDDPILRELYRKLRETGSPTATLDHLAVNVLDADTMEYVALRNASRERVEWNIRDQD